jgi:hypothetical protein
MTASIFSVSFYLCFFLPIKDDRRASGSVEGERLSSLEYPNAVMNHEATRTQLDCGQFLQMAARCLDAAEDDMATASERLLTSSRWTNADSSDYGLTVCPPRQDPEPLNTSTSFCPRK